MHTMRGAGLTGEGFRLRALVADRAAWALAVRLLDEAAPEAALDGLAREGALACSLASTRTFPAAPAFGLLAMARGLAEHGARV